MVGCVCVFGGGGAFPYYSLILIIQISGVCTQNGMHSDVWRVRRERASMHTLIYRSFTVAEIALGTKWQIWAISGISARQFICHHGLKTRLKTIITIQLKALHFDPNTRNINACSAEL